MSAAAHRSRALATRVEAPLAALLALVARGDRLPAQPLGRAEAPLGRAEAPLGRAEAPLGRAEAPLGRAEALPLPAAMVRSRRSKNAMTAT